WCELAAEVQQRRFGDVAVPITTKTGGIGLPTAQLSANPTDMLRLAPLDGRRRIADLVESWTDDLKLANNARGYINSERKIALRAAEKMLWQLPEDITAESLRKWMTALIDTGVRSKTRKNYRDTLDRFCGWLVGKGLLKENPVKTLPAPKVEKRKARIVPTDDEVRRIILAAK